MKNLYILTLLVFLSAAAQAQTQQQTDAAARESQKFTVQEQQRLDAERLRLEGQKTPTGDSLNVQGTASGKLRKADGSCPELKRINYFHYKYDNILSELFQGLNFKNVHLLEVFTLK